MSLLTRAIHAVPLVMIQIFLASIAYLENNPYFYDAKGFTCSEWGGYDCVVDGKAEGYSEQDIIDGLPPTPSYPYFSRSSPGIDNK